MTLVTAAASAASDTKLPPPIAEKREHDVVFGAGQ